MADAFQPRFVDLVRTYTSTTGTGNIVPGDAAPGFTSFAAALKPGDRFYYSVMSLDSVGESETGRGTLLEDGTIAREPVGGVATDFSIGTKTVALIASAEWFERLAAKANEVVSVEDFGTAGDGIAEDGPAVRTALAASEGRSLFAPAGRTYGMVDWVGYVPGGNLSLDVRGATFSHNGEENLFVDGQGYDIRGGTFDNFFNFVTSATPTDAPVDARFSGATFRNCGNVGLNFENPFGRFQTVNCLFDQSRSLMLRAGKDDPSLQSGWQGFSAIGNLFRDVLPSWDGDPAANGIALTYAAGSVIALNQVNGLTVGKDATGFCFYTKSVGAVVIGNTAVGATQPSGTGQFYGFNLKGAPRGDTSTPQGYGAMAIGNSMFADPTATSKTFVGGQMQSDEEAIIANYFDGFRRAIEHSGKISYSVIALNRSCGNGAASSKSIAGSVSGTAVLNIGNVTYNYIAGDEYAVASSDTLDRLTILGRHVQGTAAGSGGTGLAVTGSGTGNVTNLIVANSTFDSFSAGITLTQVYGATLTNLQFSNITNLTTQGQRAIHLNNCKRIVGRNSQTSSVQTTSTSAVPLATLLVSNANVGSLRVRLCSRKTDGTAREVIEARCAFYMEGGTVSLATPTVTKEFATGINVTFTAVAGVGPRANVTGIAGETWDHFASVDFDIL